MSVRFGFGYDVHQLVEQRDFILGGVHLPYSKGLLGHSDADVLLHAICDSLLGAAALGNIGQHFPNSDESFKNISSITLLEKSLRILQTENYTIINIDSTIVLQEPKINQFIPLMRENISRSLSISISQVSIKATTSEFLGFIGRNEGVAAYAVSSIEKI